MSRHSTCRFILPLLSAVLQLSGCQPAAPPSASDTAWDVIYMNGQPVGYQSLTLTERSDDKGTWLDAVSTSGLSLQRFGETTRESMEIGSRETIDGRVVRVESRIKSGEGELRTVGRRQENSLQLETSAGDENQQWSLSLPDDCGGYFSVEWSLKRAPLGPGEQRRLHAIVPVLNQIAEITLTAGPREAVELLDETRDLQRVDQQLNLANGVHINSVSWVTETGDVLKTHIPSLKQTTYRVDRKTALAAYQNRDPFDIGEYSRVTLSSPLVDPSTTRQVRYRVQLRDSDPGQVFLTTSSQSVIPIDSHSAEVIVRSVGPDDQPPKTPAEAGPGPAERSPSAMIQSDAASVLQLVQQIRPVGADPWSIASATERFVYETLTQKDFSTAFATAAEVARTRQGDCTEHAVLTAALCRAQGLPARVLIGLVYVPTQQGFAFHMWNEVWVREHWVPIDATLGLGGIPATHLVLARSSLETDQTFAALLPVLNVMGQMEVEVLSVER